MLWVYVTIFCMVEISTSTENYMKKSNLSLFQNKDMLPCLGRSFFSKFDSIIFNLKLKIHFF